MRIDIESGSVFVDELAWAHDGEVLVSVDGIDRFRVRFTSVGVEQSVLDYEGADLYTVTTLSDEEE